VQLVHDTDSDALLLLVIKDFQTLEFEEFEFNLKKCADLQFLVERFGHGTIKILNNVTSIFQSFEFENVIHKVYHGKDQRPQGMKKDLLN